MSEVIEEVIGVKEVEESPDDMEVSDEIEESGYKTIPISNAKEKQPKFALCSEKDYEKLKGYTWRYKKGYIATNIEGRYMTMHKMVLGTSNDGLKIDHINGDKHDNRQENLRFATSSQNGQNRPKQEDASSKLYGVKFNKNAKKFETWVTVEKDRHYLGLFENEVEAAEIVDTYVVQNFYIHKLNFPEKKEEYLKRPTVVRIKRKTKKYQGVHFKKKSNRYEASFVFEGTPHYIGMYKAESDAAHAYDKYVVEKKFDRALNFPELYPDFDPIRKIETDGIFLDDGAVQLILKSAPKTKFIVDADIYERIKFSTLSLSTNRYAIFNHTSIRLNRFIMDITDPNIFIDHIDGNPQNNRRSNLRFSNCKLNPQNQRKQENTSSKYQGVSKSVRYNGKTIRWKSSASFEFKSLCLGNFKTEDIAARARDIFIRKTHVVHHYNLAFKWDCPLEEAQWVKTLAPLWSPKARAILEKQ